jgi:hypothetical protein
MDAILSAIKTALQSSVTLVADADIFITPHLDYIPNGKAFPCIGIKDGAIQNIELMGECNDRHGTVLIAPWVEMSNDEASIVGSVAVTGLIDISDQIESALNHNLLSVSGVQTVFCDSSAPSELMGDERQYLQRKIITVTYEQEDN